MSANLRGVAEQLPEIMAPNFSIIAITVDPWWDTSSVLADYAMRQAIDWPHLTGEVEAMQPIWESFHVGLQTYLNTSATKKNLTEENQTSGRHHPDYLVDHFTATIIIDKIINSEFAGMTWIGNPHFSSRICNSSWMKS
ncbi:MAG: hypothetical protein Ct9H90mP16_02450 [Candidatus Poseidoniales archaeon]|nr:MAG: hypothetical protein Ct9H90mP16_02450 [Candidatus Poseidoniales archaeon]